MIICLLFYKFIIMKKQIQNMIKVPYRKLSYLQCIFIRTVGEFDRGYYSIGTLSAFMLVHFTIIIRYLSLSPFSFIYRPCTGIDT